MGCRQQCGEEKVIVSAPGGSYTPVSISKDNTLLNMLLTRTNKRGMSVGWRCVHTALWML